MPLIWYYLGAAHYPSCCSDYDQTQRLMGLMLLIIMLVCSECVGYCGYWPSCRSWQICLVRVRIYWGWWWPTIMEYTQVRFESTWSDQTWGCLLLTGAMLFQLCHGRFVTYDLEAVMNCQRDSPFGSLWIQIAVTVRFIVIWKRDETMAIAEG